MILLNLLLHLHTLSYIGRKTRIKLDRVCVKQDKITSNHGKTVNIYIVYEINLWNYVGNSDPTLGNLFGAIWCRY